MKVMQFQGNSMANKQPVPPMVLQPITEHDLTPSPDVPLAILKRKMMASNDINVARGLLMEINAHLKVKGETAVCEFSIYSRSVFSVSAGCKFFLSSISDTNITMLF